MEINEEEEYLKERRGVGVLKVLAGIGVFVMYFAINIAGMVCLCKGQEISSAGRKELKTYEANQRIVMLNDLKEELESDDITPEEYVEQYNEIEAQSRDEILAQDTEHSEEIAAAQAQVEKGDSIYCVGACMFAPCFPSIIVTNFPARYIIKEGVEEFNECDYELSKL